MGRITIRAAMALVLFAPFATEAPAADDDAPIIVTGSRIARPQAQTSLPEHRLDAMAIAHAGQGNLADILRRDPVFAGGFGPGNSNMRTAGNGLNLIDLHGLGTARTLVLVNGRRVVAGLGGATAPDLNMIPLDLVDRVEVVTGGGSAVYGSDALAGVVNILLRRPQGVSLTAQSGISDAGDAPHRRISGSVGTALGERAHGWLHATYDQDGGLRSSARPISAKDYLGPSPFPSQGAFALGGTIYGITGVNAADGLVFGNDYTYVNGTLTRGFRQNSEGFDRNAYRRISVPLDRLLLGGGVEADVGAMTFYVEGSYGETRSRSMLEPYAAAGGDPLRDGASAIEVPGGIRLDNPYIPATIAAEIAARNGDGTPTNDVGFIAFRRRLTDVFDRSNRNVRRLWRGVAGAKGTVGGWAWDVGYVYGRTTDHSAADTLPRERLRQAIDAVRLGGAIVCRDPAARAAGCQPLNIFGAATATPAAIGWLRGAAGLQTTLDSRIEQHVVTATLGGSLFGRARLVAGAEYRHESSADDWDEDTNAGRTLAARADDVRGAFGVGSAFAELAAPLARAVDVEGAARLDRYSTAGTVFNWRIGGGWRPFSAVRFRAAYAVASRAPSIAELYTTQRETFPGTLTLDPCAGVTATRANAFDGACRAVPGIAAAIGTGGALAYSTAEVQAINGFNGGNPALRAETGRSLTAGLTLEPAFLHGLTLNLDYFRIALSRAISTQPRAETVKACLVDAASFACAGLVQRLPNGKIARVDALLVNGGGIRHAGIDMAARYRLPVGSRVGVTVGGRWTHLLEHKRQAFASAPFVDELGQFQDADHARLGSGFRNRFVADATMSAGAVSLNWTMRYFGPILDTRDALSAPTAAINRVPAVAYHDAQLRVALPGGARRAAWLGVTNLFDRVPPSLPNGVTASGLLGVETAQEYDVVGRSFYLGMTLGF